MTGETGAFCHVTGKPWDLGMDLFTVLARPKRENISLPSLQWCYNFVEKKMKKSPGNRII